MAEKTRITEILGATLALGFLARRLKNGHVRRDGSAPREQPRFHEQPRLQQTERPRPAPATHAAPPARPEPQRAAGALGKIKMVPKAVSRFMDDDGTTMAAALAYYTTFSIAPLLLIVISIVGLIFGRQMVQKQIQDQIQGLIGQGAASQVGLMVRNAGEHSSGGIISAILGGIALLFGATGAFSQLQSSLDAVWRVKPDPKAGGIKNFIGHRVLTLGMVLAIAFLLLVSLAVSAALTALGDYASGLLPQGFSKPVLLGITFVVSLAIISALFAAMFKILPDADIEWRDVWTGGIITAVLFTIGKFLIGLYLGHSGTASAYGAAGSFVLVIVWIYYSSLIFLFGAELTAVWSEAGSGSVRPKPGAVKVVTEERIEPRRAA